MPDHTVAHCSGIPDGSLFLAGPVILDCLIRRIGERKLGDLATGSEVGSVTPPRGIEIRASAENGVLEDVCPVVEEEQQH